MSVKFNAKKTNKQGFSKIFWFLSNIGVSLLPFKNRILALMFTIKEVITKKDIKQFVDFPFNLYKADKHWVPPLKKDEIKQLNAESNPAYEFCEAKFWTAWNGNTCVGRIGGIINHAYNEKTGEGLGRITRCEFIDNKEVSSVLFDTVEKWFKEKGLAIAHGPLGFSNLDNQGLLIEGFDYLPSVASVYHKPYYQKHFEELAYTKENDWVEFRLTLGEQALNKGIRGAQIVKRRYGFEVLSFSTTDELRPYSRLIFEVLNEAFADLPYVTPFTDKMIELYGEKYFKILNPKFVKIIKKDGNLAAFIIGMPSLSEAMQKARGSLFPFGFYHVLKALKKPTVIDLLLTAVVPEYQSSGAAVILFAELQAEMLKQGINQMETTGIFETNHNVISNWKNYEHIQHKRRRSYRKEL